MMNEEKVVQQNSNVQKKISEQPASDKKKEFRNQHLQSILSKIARLKFEAVRIMRKLSYSNDVISRTINEIVQREQGTTVPAKVVKESVERDPSLQPLSTLVSENMILENEMQFAFGAYLLSQH
jgi:hypothetical protein